LHGFFANTPIYCGGDTILGDKDFEQSGLKVTSVIRVGRLVVVSGEILLGALGEISQERLHRVKQTSSDWLSEKSKGG